MKYAEMPDVYKLIFTSKTMNDNLYDALKAKENEEYVKALPDIVQSNLSFALKTRDEISAMERRAKDIISREALGDESDESLVNLLSESDDKRDAICDCLAEARIDMAFNGYGADKLEEIQRQALEDYISEQDPYEMIQSSYDGVQKFRDSIDVFSESDAEYYR